MKKLESGRSMVEMLGVLAIIGVLSIGGIAGYTLSMRRYRANQVLDMANKYALVVYGSCQQGLINGDIKTISECAPDNIMTGFSDANLGTVADVTEFGSPNITQLSGTDVVTIPAYFRDVEVCKAAKSIIGSKKDIDCSKGNRTTYLLDIPIKQNWFFMVWWIKK